MTRLLTVLALAAFIPLACSGKTNASPDGNSGSGGTQLDASACPPDLRAGAAAECQAITPACASGVCFIGDSAWTCSPSCPCPSGWECAWVGQAEGCVPAAIGACFTGAGGGGTGGGGGAGGGGGDGGTGLGGSGATGGAGGGGGTGASGGTAGTGASGGTGGIGGGGGQAGTGPCSGDPACTGTEATFCSGTRMVHCTPQDTCPDGTECAVNCSGCTCHQAPPLNGIINAGCDECVLDTDCATDQKCIENPNLAGSGARMCVMK